MTREADKRARFGFVFFLNCLVFAGGSASAESLAKTRTFDYLHVAANEGGSSGGHVAVRFDDWTYHFQRSPDALLELYRDDSDVFLHRYAVLGNRAIFAHSVGVDAETYELLRSRFNTAYLAELERSETLRSLRADERLLEDLAGGVSPTVMVRGAGYFEASGSGAPTLTALRRYIEEIRGQDFLAQRIEEVESRLAGLEPQPDLPGDSQPAVIGRGPHYGFADRYVDLISARTALQILRDAPPPREQAYRRPSGPEYVLTDAESAKLEVTADRLTEQLNSLVVSERPDWAYAFLIGAARLAAIHASIETGAIVVLDSYAADAVSVEGRKLARRGATVHENLLAELRKRYRRERSRLMRSQQPGERAYARFEESVNRLEEFETAVRTGAEARISREALVPQLEAAANAPNRETVERSMYQGAYERARERRRGYDYELRRDHGYHLVRRNCASEIFRTINGAFDEGAVQASTRRLGGYIDPDSEFTFVPFLSANNVVEQYNVVESKETPSYRQARLRRMYDTENDFVVYMREFNTLTSTVYSRNLDDSAFLAFTDDVVWARPLLGAVNVTASIGRSLFGILRLPFDRGEMLVAGLRGAFYSVPELAFVNIRKGSQYYVAPEQREVVTEVVLASAPADAARR